MVIPIISGSITCQGARRQPPTGCGPALDSA